MIVGQRIKDLLITYNISFEEVAYYLDLSKEVLLDKFEGRTRLFHEEVTSLLCFINSRLPDDEKQDLNEIFGWNLR